VPGLVRRAVQEYSRQYAAGLAIGPLLDLGCGTGLVGVALSDIAMAELVGVDLSPRMIEAAEEKNIYHALHVGEIGAFLHADRQAYEIIVAADVFCYFGDLRGIIAAARDRLAPGGQLIFTAEDGAGRVDEAGWVLGPQGRYAHRLAYIQQCLRDAGLRMLDMRSETLRQEAEQPVAGFLAIAERPA